MTTSATSVVASAPGFFAALDTLRLVLERLGAERDLEQLYTATVREVAGFFEVEQCALFLRDEFSGHWSGVRAAVGLTEAQLQALDAVPPTATAQLLAAWSGPGVVRLLGPAHMPPAYEEVAHLLNERDVLLAQLSGYGRPFGLLLLANRLDAAPFAAADEQFLAFFAGQASILMQNLRLLSQEQGARRLAETLLQVPQVIRPLPPQHEGTPGDPVPEALAPGLAQSELRPVLARLLRLLSEVVDCDGAKVAILEGAQLRIIAAFGYPTHAHLVGYSWQAEAEPRLVEMIESGGPVSIPDTRQDPRWRPFRGGEEIRAWIGAPIWAPGSARHRWVDLIGVLYVDGSIPGVFTPADMSVAQAFADQMAIVLENQRLYTRMARTAMDHAHLLRETQLHLQRAEQRSRELALLNQVTAAINSAMNLDEVLDLILGQMQRLVHFDQAMIALLDGPDLRVVDASGFPPDVAILGQRFSWDQFALTRQVIENARLVAVADVGQDERWSPAQHPGPARAWLGVPLVHGGKPTGIMTLTALRPTVYSIDDERLVLALAEQAALAIEKARLLDETQAHLQRAQRRSAELGQIARVSASLSASLEVDAVLQNTVNELAKALDVEQAGLVILDFAAGFGRLTAEYQHEPDNSGRDTRIPIAGNLSLERVLTSKAPLAIRDAQHDPLLFNVQDVMRLRGVKSILLVPLIVRGEVIGTVGLDELHAMRDFSAAEIELAQTITNQAAAAIASARLLEDARRRAFQLETIQAVTQRITAILDVDELLIQVADLLAERFGYYHVHVFVADEAGEYLLARGGNGEAGRGLVASHLRLRIGSDGICGHAAGLGQTLLVNDVSLDPRYLFHAALTETRAELAVPIKLRGRLMGVLNVESDQVGAFTQSDAFLMETLADQVAIALENARLFSTVQQRADELTVAFDDLKELDHMKDEFVQTVSHELRTPLTFIKGYVELLLEGDLGDLSADQADALRIVMERTENITHLVNDIISLTRAESMQLTFDSLDLTSLARAALHSAGAVTGQVRMRLELDAEPGLPRVRGDSQRLSQVFDNLLGNAIKFSPEGGLISVRLRRQGSLVLAEVSDQGIGIPADRLNRIWDRFYQVDGTTTRRFGGTGLGLAIVKRLIEAHGGEVGVSSIEGRGSTFYFTIPVDAVPKE